ncbi:MAG: RloB domain-containing protein [Elusimicrobiota bacterium]
MPSTDPLKKSRRASKTLLIFGEGLCEEMFLKHLRSLYSYNSGVAITIRKGRGGNAQGIVIDAHRIPGAYNRKIVVFDNDKSESEINKARAEAKKRRIVLLENTPCLEFVLLSIVNGKPVGQSSSWCKSEFESKFMGQAKRGEPSEYMKVFPKTLLDDQRATIPKLNRLVDIMEGNIP